MMRDIFLTLVMILSLTAITACGDDGLGIGVGGDTGLSGIDAGSFDQPGPDYYRAVMDNAISRGIKDEHPFSPMDRTDLFSSADEKAYSCIGIRGSKAASMHGNWRVDVYQDGRQMANQRFRVAPDYSSFEVAPDGYHEFSSYYGDCAARPPGTYCLVFSDYYTYLAHDSVTDGVWAQAGYWNGRAIEVIYGVNADYYHVLYTPLLKIVPKTASGYGLSEAFNLASNPEPDYSASMDLGLASGYASAPDASAAGLCDCGAMAGSERRNQEAGLWGGMDGKHVQP